MAGDAEMNLRPEEAAALGYGVAVGRRPAARVRAADAPIHPPAPIHHRGGNAVLHVPAPIHQGGGNAGLVVFLLIIALAVFLGIIVSFHSDDKQTTTTALPAQPKEHSEPSMPPAGQTNDAPLNNQPSITEQATENPPTQVETPERLPDAAPAAELTTSQNELKDPAIALRVSVSVNPPPPNSVEIPEILPEQYGYGCVGDLPPYQGEWLFSAAPQEHGARRAFMSPGTCLVIDLTPTRWGYRKVASLDGKYIGYAWFPGVRRPSMTNEMKNVISKLQQFR